MTAIDLDLATLCADCRTVHDEPSGACPRCTSEHGLSLARILDRPDADEPVSVEFGGYA